MQPVRKILHLDMDAFYASVEQRDHPHLRGRPVAVGGSPDGRGVVCAASYEARPFGVRSALSSSKAARLCPGLVFVKPRFDAYRAVSREVFAELRAVTPLVEPLSIDEAFLDVTENALGEGSATRVAQHLRTRIRERVGLTASVGVSHLKFVAKIASDVNKPDGLTIVPPDGVLGFLHPLPVSRLWGVGPVATQRLHDAGFVTIKDVAEADAATLVAVLGTHGRALHRMAHGDWHRPVVPNRRRRSVSAERTLSEDLSDPAVMHEILAEQSERVADGVARRRQVARTVSLKVRFSDFQTVTRSRTLARPTADSLLVAHTASLLLQALDLSGRSVRLLGVGLSGLEPAPAGEQLSLWPSHRPG